MQRFILIFIVMLLIGFSGCSDNRAEELYETAKLEELQNNPDHAANLYREIIAKYPGSEYAEIAQSRLAEMGETGNN